MEEQGSNGFLITVKVHDRDQLELSATRIDRDLAIETATYKMPLRPQRDPSSIEASFGKLGRIDMHFIPLRTKETSPGKLCIGGKIVEEEGEWAGLIAFHGERGFTDVRVRRTFGTVTKVPSLRCRPEKAPNLKKLERELEALEKEQGEEAGEEGAEPSEEEPQAVELVASARHHRVALVISRSAFGEGRKRTSTSNLIAIGTRRRGRIKEAASVVDIFAPGSYFRPTDSREPATEALVKPPVPFSGSAIYRTPPKGSPTWDGDLKVDLPGFGDVRLAGRGTRAAICEGFTTKCGSGLDGRASALLLAGTAP